MPQNTPQILTEDEYKDLRAKEDKNMEWVRRVCPKGGALPERPAEVPDIGNANRSLLEVYEWMKTPPDRYFVYVSLTDKEPAPRTEHTQGRTIHNVRNDSGRKGNATTWTGDVLGSVQCGREWRDSFGGTRVPITVFGNNGRTYTGTYYKSSGSYARIRETAASKKAREKAQVKRAEAEQAEVCEHVPAPRVVPALGAPLPTCAKCGQIYMDESDED